MKEKIIKMHLEEKMSIQSIADELHLTYQEVRDTLSEAKIKIRESGRGYKLLGGEKEDEMVKMYLAGYTVKQLSQLFSVKPKRLEKYLGNRGIRKMDR